METPGISLEAIDTPALVVDLDLMEGNIARMANFFAGVSATLRPHTKTHKTPALAHKQIEAGAKGVTCAKLGEAEVMAASGIRDLLIANQVIGRTKIDRLVALARHSDVIVAVDHSDNVREISEAARAVGATVGMLIEVNVGMNRCGVEPGEPTLQLAQIIHRLPGVRFAGVMGYEGHIINDPDQAVRERECRKSMGLLTETAAYVRQAGLPVNIVSGGGTGTYKITGTFPGVTEVQAGSYLFMDATYHKIIPEFDCALTIYTTVVSRPGDTLAIVDAGLKTMTTEFGFPTVRDRSGATLIGESEEHGKLRLDGASVSLRPGEKIHLLPSHVCTTINLHDRLYGVRNGRLETIWTVAARGKIR